MANWLALMEPSNYFHGILRAFAHEGFNWIIPVRNVEEQPEQNDRTIFGLYRGKHYFNSPILGA